MEEHEVIRQKRQMAVIDESIKSGPWTFTQFAVICRHYRLTDDMMYELIYPQSDSLLVVCKDGMIRER